MKKHQTHSGAEDLTGRTFGELYVIERAPDHICAGGQKKVCWLCRCNACGELTTVTAQSLKRGSAKNCGCMKYKRPKNKKICIICGKEFFCPPSAKTVTCSNECSREYSRRRMTGRQVPEETRMKISKNQPKKDMTALQEMALQAVRQSPKAGRFETNVHAVDWHLISPGGQHYYFHSLQHWLRQHCEEFFGCKADTREFNNVRSGLSGAKRAALGKIINGRGCCTYKGWQVIPTEKDMEDAKNGKT